MSEKPSPVELLFEMQRDTLQQTGDILEDFFDMSADVGESVAGGFETQQEFQEQALEMARESMHQSLDAVESVTDTTTEMEGVPAPETSVEDLRETVDSTFDTLLDQQTEAFNSLDSEYERFSEEAGENVSKQIETLIEFNERVETQLLDSVERLVEQAEDADDLTETLQSQVEQLSEQFERQADRFGDLETQFQSIDVDSTEETQ